MKIHVGESKIEGKGIFATKDIKKGEIVGTIKGPNMYKVNINLEDALSNPNWIGFKMHNWVNPVTPYEFLNHSCDPNTGIKGHKRMIALHNIKKGEEVTIDYSIIEADPRWYMNCSCNGKKCRGTIESIQKLPRKIYDSYLPFISKHFKDIYEKENHLR